MGDQVKALILTNGDLENLLLQKSDVIVRDIVEAQSAEIQRINDPTGEHPPEERTVEVVNVYYPWLGTVVKCLSDDNLYRLRTNRNRELITTEEQEKLKKSVVAVAGMSVGSSIAMSVVYSGMSRSIKIADNDVLDTSNLNRLRESLVNVGLSKTELTARHIYELDPFADVQQFDQGLTVENIDQFLENVNVVVDEIDDFRMKVIMRKKAKEKGVPLLMFTSLGDSILIDIERYDTDPETRPFNGLLADDGQEILDNPEIDANAIKRYSISVVGPEYIPTRALQSVMEMGRTLVGRPQLYSTIAVDGGLAGYIIRQILLGTDVKSGRYNVKFSEFFGLESDTHDTDVRQEILQLLNRV